MSMNHAVGVSGFSPPHPHDPPTKRPLVARMRQARASGVGVVLATITTPTAPEPGDVRAVDAL